LSMRVLVAVKRVVDFAVKVRVNAAKTAVETTNVKMSMNPFDEIGVEAAVKLKEAKVATEVVAVSIGPKQSVETIRTALAMGADRGILIETDLATDSLQPLAVAKALRALATREKPDLVIVGKQAIDGDNNQTAQMLSQLLNWPQGLFASAINISAEKKSMEITREVDGGMQVVEMGLPAVISTDLRLNTPRFASLPNIMKARKKEIETIKLQDLVGDLTSRLEILEVVDPPVRSSGIKVEDAQSLFNKLRNEKKII